jgi:hypothetical protein
MALYAGCEDVDGCVFREDVDIFDNMQAIVSIDQKKPIRIADLVRLS